LCDHLTMARMSKQMRDDIDRAVRLLASVASQFGAKQRFLAALYKNLAEAIERSQYGNPPTLQVSLPPDSKTTIQGKEYRIFRGEGLCTIEPDDEK
jgi:hypothetical protein